jgi:hypothetical protein
VTRAPNAVNIFLGKEWDVVIDHATGGGYMQSARGNIRGHNNVGMSGGKGRKRLGSLPLTAIAMDQHGLDCMSAQCRCNPSRTSSGSTEHHDSLAISVFDESNRQRSL